MPIIVFIDLGPIYTYNHHKPEVASKQTGVQLKPLTVLTGSEKPHLSQILQLVAGVTYHPMASSPVISPSNMRSNLDFVISPTWESETGQFTAITAPP